MSDDASFPDTNPVFVVQRVPYYRLRLGQRYATETWGDWDGVRGEEAKGDRRKLHNTDVYAGPMKGESDE